MPDIPAAFAELEQRIVAWAGEQDDVRAAIVLGSRARSDPPADAYSDLDMLLIATDPARYLDSADWLDAFGVPQLTFVEGTATGIGKERRVLFDGGLDVDFSVLPVALFARLFAILEQADLSAPDRQHPDVQHADSVIREFHSVARRGYRLLVDKDGFLARTVALFDRLPMQPSSLPSERDFLESVNDFWYHALWTARKLRRGELWIAIHCCDGSLKSLLLQMITWHARVTHGAHYETWHRGRFLERWADPSILATLRDCFAHYDAADVRAALLATIDLFRRLATETATRLGYAYPTGGDHYATRLVHETVNAIA